MPEIGAPTSNIQKELNKVSMRRKDESQGELTKEQIIEKVSGKKVFGQNAPKVSDRNTHGRIGKDEFLKMLSHQMQNQDPMNPMDQNKFAADLAQFSQLEQLTNLNTKFDGLKENSIMERKFFAANFIGKSVVTEGNTVELKSDGERKKIHFNLDRNAKNVLIRIHDSKNNIASEVKLENIPAGANSIEWDGKSLDGFDSPKGEYHVSVKAWDEGFKPILTKTKHEGVVQSVYFDRNEPIFDLGNRKVALRDVSSFHLAKKATKSPQKAAAEYQRNNMNMKGVQ